MSGPCVTDTPSVALSATNNGLRAEPVISSDLDNTAECRSSGLYAPSIAGRYACVAEASGSSVASGFQLLTLAAGGNGYDPNNMLVTASNWILIKADGYYRVQAQFHWTSGGGGAHRYVSALWNDTVNYARRDASFNSIGNAPAAGDVTGRAWMRLHRGDHLQLRVFAQPTVGFTYTGSLLGVWWMEDL